MTVDQTCGAGFGLSDVLPWEKGLSGCVQWREKASAPPSAPGMPLTAFQDE